MPINSRILPMSFTSFSLTLLRFYFLRRPRITSTAPEINAIALPAEKGGPISTLVDAALNSDQAFEIDCPDILKIVGPEILKGLGSPTFLKGFVVIQSAIELDVVTVYTAAGTASGPVSAMEISRAPARKM